MSRNNVFKLSGNMALGSNETYANSDFENIKSSLKLLKSKQTQKQPNAPLEPTVLLILYRTIMGDLILPMRPLASNQFPKVKIVTYRYSLK
jgi:hypothetical protein